MFFWNSLAFLMTQPADVGNLISSSVFKKKKDFQKQSKDGKIVRNSGNCPTDSAHCQSWRYNFKDPEKNHPGSASKPPISLEEFSHSKTGWWLMSRIWALGVKVPPRWKQRRNVSPTKGTHLEAVIRRSSVGIFFVITNPAGGTLADEKNCQSCLTKGWGMWVGIKARKSKGKTTKAFSLQKRNECTICKVSHNQANWTTLKQVVLSNATKY